MSAIPKASELAKAVEDINNAANAKVLEQISRILEGCKTSGSRSAIFNGQMPVPVQVHLKSLGYGLEYCDDPREREVWWTISF